MARRADGLRERVDLGAQVVDVALAFELCAEGTPRDAARDQGGHRGEEEAQEGEGDGREGHGAGPRRERTAMPSKVHV
jgi:hypothetical protein